jgi:hypothetical protein
MLYVLYQYGQYSHQGYQKADEAEGYCAMLHLQRAYTFLHLKKISERRAELRLSDKLAWFK